MKNFYYHFAVKSKVMQMTTCNQEFLCFFIQVLHSTVLHALHCKVSGLDHSRATFQAFVLFVVLEQWAAVQWCIVHTVQLCIDPRELFLTFVWLHDRATTQPLAVIYCFAIHLPGWSEMIMKISESESGDRMVSVTPSSVIVKKWRRTVNTANKHPCTIYHVASHF